MSQTEQVKKWQTENAGLSKLCLRASHKLNDALHELLGGMAIEIEDADFTNEFNIIEFIDKYGHRFNQLNAIVAGLSTLGTPV